MARQVKMRRFVAVPKSVDKIIAETELQGNPARRLYLSITGAVITLLVLAGANYFLLNRELSTLQTSGQMTAQVGQFRAVVQSATSALTQAEVQQYHNELSPEILKSLAEGLGQQQQQLQTAYASLNGLFQSNSAALGSALGQEINGVGDLLDTLGKGLGRAQQVLKPEIRQAERASALEAINSQIASTYATLSQRLASVNTLAEQEAAAGAKTFSQVVIINTSALVAILVVLMVFVIRPAASRMKVYAKDAEERGTRLARTLERMQEQEAQLRESAQSLAKHQDELRNNLHRMEETNHALREARKVADQQRSQADEARALAESAKVQMANMNSLLEQRVSERTSELERAFKELQSAQHQLVLSEKMAVLGQLVAGVAHEMNTPLGAIKAAASNVIDVLPRILALTSDFLPKQDPVLTAMAASLIIEIMTKPEMLSSRESRQLRKSYAEEMEEAGVANAADAARTLVESGYHGPIAPYLLLLRSPNAEEFLDMVGLMGQIILNLHNISLATEKTSKVVFALKNYSHTRQSESVEPASLSNLLDTVLSIYHNQLKYGIEVTSDYDDVPPVPCFADELSQVWTNLVSNAMQAMEGRGTLHVELRNLGNVAQIRITDSGPGIPAHVQPRVFEPFYTTKERGQGTGLGLDICKKIVDKHEGRIYFDTEPGRTTFIVELPLTGPKSSPVKESRVAGVA